MTPRIAVAFALLGGAAFYAPPTQQAVSAINATVSEYLQAHPSQSVPVLVQAKGDPAPVERAIASVGGHIDSQFSSLSGFSATVSRDTADRLNHDSRVRLLNINASVKWQGAVNYSSLLNRYDPLSRVPVAWDGGLDGSGVKVAVIDTGAWPHNDLIQKSSAVPGNVGNRLLVVTTNPNATDALDHYGHGTHVAGVVAGNGYDSGGQYIGVAPNSLIISVKVSDDLGKANEGDLITGMEWVYQANKHGMHIGVVNLSVNSTVAQSYHQSALDAMAEKLWKSGVAVVVAAGNGTGTVQYAPANDPFVITVGSIDDYYQTTLSGSQMASWALYGTTQDGFAKPDLVADGSHVVSLLAPASQLSVGHTANIVTPTYFKMGGTSMAAPAVAGMAALMLQNNPNLSNNKIKARLRKNTSPFSTVAYTSKLGIGGGFLDVRAVGAIDDDDNVGVTTSQSFDPLSNNVLAGGIWWVSGNWPSTVAWNNVGWNNVGWNSTDFSNVGWNNVGSASPTQMATTYWSNVGWNNVGWNNVGWNNVGWNNVGWNNVGWNNVGWNNVGWNDGSWN